MPVWINYVFRARSPSREAATNGAAKSIKQNVVSNLRTAVERERNRECEWDRGKVAKCSRACKTLSHKICNLQSRSQLDRGCCRQFACWARYCPLTVGILHGQRARERECGSQSKRQFPHVLPAMRHANYRDRQGDQSSLWHVPNLIALQIAWLNCIKSA